MEEYEVVKEGAEVVSFKVWRFDFAIMSGLMYAFQGYILSKV